MSLWNLLAKQLKCETTILDSFQVYSQFTEYRTKVYNLLRSNLIVVYIFIITVAIDLQIAQYLSNELSTFWNKIILMVFVSNLTYKSRTTSTSLISYHTKYRVFSLLLNLMNRCSLLNQRADLIQHTFCLWLQFSSMFSRFRYYFSINVLGFTILVRIQRFFCFLLSNVLLLLTKIIAFNIPEKPLTPIGPHAYNWIKLFKRNKL